MKLTGSDCRILELQLCCSLDLAGGGLIRRFKLMLEMLPNNKESADQIVQAAWFNPDIAAFLLERPLKNKDAGFNNVPLRRLIAAANASRESGNE